ncbi:hypothetical protein SAMN02982929_04588 [Saccharopolyspora kobensis]|uniref:Uncharacterized protein n=1 Tax=Saccharopolyspora kobensis TaxID=146035 RepID=A0A1H6DIY3_9PSEU|nr:hypothetical protein [Saccharopolyspora kobensis]SEG85417.1 hypothetical protein SAMN02982929_04588 [Saccharopolyspora kobensis]SFD24235.1 hypothetical protein SAMN05216506_103202 [Saccharopolyspora kobensis]
MAFASVLGIVVPSLSGLLTVISYVAFALEIIRYLDDAVGPLLFNTANTLGTLVLVGLWVFFSLRMRAGRSRARTTLAVVAGIWLLYALFGLFVTLSTADYQLSVIFNQAGTATVLVELLMVVLAMPLFLALIFLTPSNQYFKANQQPTT